MVLVLLLFEIGWVFKLISNWFGFGLNNTQLNTALKKSLSYNNIDDPTWPLGLMPFTAPILPSWN